MTKDKFLESLSKLVEGKFTPEDWIFWWNKNAIEIQKNISRNDFLKLKPLVSQSEIRATIISQNAANLILIKENIILKKSNYYSELWNEEFSEFQKKEGKEGKAFRRKFIDEFKNLKDKFPTFYKSLAKHLSSDDQIVLGNKKILDSLELLIQKRLPSEIQEFIKNISMVKIEGFRFDVSEIQLLKIDSIEYIYLGNLNLYSDGDSILLKIDDENEGTIYYLYHSEKPAKIIKLVSDFNAFIEKTLVEFIRE